MKIKIQIDVLKNMDHLKFGITFSFSPKIHVKHVFHYFGIKKAMLFISGLASRIFFLLV